MNLAGPDLNALTNDIVMGHWKEIRHQQEKDTVKTDTGQCDMAQS